METKPKKKAGRPKGSKSSPYVKYATEAVANRKKPLDIMLEAMWRRDAAGDEEGAVSIAKDAAPYIHPKIQPKSLGAETEQTVNININSKDISDAVAAAIAEYKLSN